MSELEVQTQKLIQDLSQKVHEPTESQDWPTQYWASWIGCASIMALLTYVAAALLPDYIHLPTNLRDPRFWVQEGLWLLVALLSARASYVYSFPTERPRESELMLILLMSALCASLFLAIDQISMLRDLGVEAQLDRGPCGGFIALTGALGAGWMFFVIKRAAPIHLSRTATYAALSMATLSSALMHLVCTHENPIHVVIWHLVPVVALGAASAVLGKKLLRW
jgi:hypothetical protein